MNITQSPNEQHATALPAPALRDAVSVRYMYNDPCHSPMKTYEPQQVVNQLMGMNVPLNERCCGEAGTFGVTLPRRSPPRCASARKKKCAGCGCLACGWLSRQSQDSDFLPVVPARLVALQRRSRHLCRLYCGGNG